MTINPERIIQTLAQKLSTPAHKIEAAVKLLDEGATVPFIARYRKEATGGLDDTLLRQLEVSLIYFRELEERRLSILESIRSQDKLTTELEAAIWEADNKQRLEDLYAPYKPKRRTRAQIAKEAGLEPLADAILSTSTAPQVLAEAYLNEQITDTKMALDGARDILAERFSENADLIAHMRDYLNRHAILYSKVADGKEIEGDKFKDWFDFHESIRTLPSHRVLALLRGRQLGVLDLRIGLSQDQEALLPHPCMSLIQSFLNIEADFSPNATARTKWLAELLRWTWRVKLLSLFETELIGQLREKAETEAIRVFASNLKDLLLAAPAGHKAVLGLDPGIRTGVKVAAIDHTGKLLDTTTVYPFEPRKDLTGTIHTLLSFVQKYGIELIAIGNGTASRETERLVSEMIRTHGLTVTKVVVSEAGASVYSASELAAQEFPDLDVSLRGAVSIARRLQDPLAELVKIEPKSIGVGQYQHDVNQRELARTLDTVIEDCVNAVGVDVNTASASLLSRVSGLNTSLAKNIVAWRNDHGAFPNRKALMNVPRFGEKAFEQAAGFLRIPNGDNPLDQSAVHPEAYPVVQAILDKLRTDITQLMNNKDALKGVSPQEFTTEQFGLPTVKDIFAELEKPGRDPRPEFTTAHFRDDVHHIEDLKIGMILEGTVTNVANFGAFVDIGVHQDGLVHISALSHKFVSDPREVVRTGQTVKVRVLEVDPRRKRIALSMRLDDERSGTVANATSSPSGAKKPARPAPTPRGAMAEAFAKLKR